MNTDCLIRPKDVETIIKRKELIRNYKASGKSAADFAAGVGISRATFYRLLEKEGAEPQALIDKRGRNKGRLLKINNEMTTWLLQFFADHASAGIASIHRALVEKAAEQKWTRCPSYWWVVRFIDKISPDIKIALAQGARARVEQAALTIQRIVSQVNSLWQADVSEAPIWVFDPTRTTSQINDSAAYFRPHILSIIDCSSRVSVALFAFDHYPTNADALYCVKRAIAASDDPRKFWFGRPHAINTDNHKIFHPAGDWGRSLLMAGIDAQYSPNEAPEASGKVERLFHTFSSRIWSTLSSYADQHRALSKAKRSCIPWPLFQKYLDRMVYERYHLVEHSEIQKTPYEAWLDGMEDALGLVYDIPELDRALRVSLDFEVYPKGVEVAHLRWYTAAFLEGLVESKITVRIPPPPEPLPTLLPAYLNTEYLGELTCQIDDSIAAEIREARLDRTQAIHKLRKTLIEGARSNPLPSDPSIPPSKPSPVNPPITPAFEEPPSSSIGPIPKMEHLDDEPNVS